MDNLPAATKMIRELPGGDSIVMYDRGYPIGFMGSKVSTRPLPPLSPPPNPPLTPLTPPYPP